MKEHAWDGSEYNWTHQPAHYGAIHFKEELTHTHSANTGETCPFVRCDMVFYETLNGGAVFSTSCLGRRPVPQRLPEQRLTPDRECHPALPRSNPVLNPARPRLPTAAARELYEPAIVPDQFCP